MIASYVKKSSSPSHFIWKTLDWGKKGWGNTEGAQKKDFCAIPCFLVIADYEKAFRYVALK